MKNLLKYVMLFILSVSVALSQAVDVTAVALVGKEVTLTVTADGTVPFTYQWRKDGVNISGATGNPYVIPSAALTSAGGYSVVVSNSMGSATSNLAVLKVMSPPVFTLQPVNTSTTIGKPFTLTVAATSTPSPTYQWLKNGISIAGATSATYTVVSATTADAGTYTCVATSTLDSLVSSATSAAAIVSVSAVPPTVKSINISIK